MFNSKEEQKYERLRKLGQELHIPIPEAFLTLEVFGKNGKLLQRYHQRSHSWVRNAYNVMFSQMAMKNGDDPVWGAGHLNVKKTSGAIWSFEICLGTGGTGKDVDGTSEGYRAPAGIAVKGILVGSGTDAESFEDFFLQTQIAEGAGAGQLNHAQSEAHAISYAALVFKNELARYFNNNSGGNIDVNEVVLTAEAGSGVEHIVSRDKLPATVTVPDTGQLKVTYTIQLTYPS
ncbi:hypothetical protein ES705_34699 [subsurface metagenome]